MKSAALLLSPNQLDQLANSPLTATASIVLVFAPLNVLEDEKSILTIKSHVGCPVLFCSTAGQISGTTVDDEKIAFTIITLECSRLAVKCLNIENYPNVTELGAALFDSLVEDDIAGLMVFADGTSINGSLLNDGLESNNSRMVPITGGLAGDGARFEKTLVGIDQVQRGAVAAVAFYGDAMEVGHGSRGGWSKGSKEYMVSSSDGNVLKEIEGVPALDMYRRNLGAKLDTLPSDALKFPLNVSDPFSGKDLVRTILNVDEEKKTMTFAGDVPVLSNVQILHASKEDLISGSKSAALVALEETSGATPDLTILISCIGRKLVLEERTAEEVQAIRDTFGPSTTMSGFYSYGELCPSSAHGRCELHNQTMTITTLREKGC